MPTAIGKPPRITPANTAPPAVPMPPTTVEQEQRQALEQVEALGADRAERAGVERAADAGHRRREREHARASGG